MRNEETPQKVYVSRGKSYKLTGIHRYIMMLSQEDGKKSIYAR